MRVSLDSCNQVFGAKIMSKWCCSSPDGRNKTLTVVSLERKDLPFINKFIGVEQKTNETADIKQIILDCALKTAKNFLESKFEGFEKTKILLGICDLKPCGVLVANVPKLSESGEISYTSRHNSSKNEGELDWLVTWNSDEQNPVKGVGKALMGELFKTLKSDRVGDVYVKSELPENSYAQYFYEALGFEYLSGKRAKLERRTSKPYLVDTFSNPEDMIVPMIITRKNWRSTLDMLQKTMHRVDMKNKSMEIEKLVNL